MNMRALACLGALVLVTGCNGGDPTVTDDTDTPTPSCATVSNQFPAPDATNVYYRSTLTFDFSEADESAEVTLTDPDGTEVAGSGEWFGLTYAWTPSAPLDPSTSYDVTLSFCDGEQTPQTSFTTSAVGSPVALADVETKTYVLDIGPDSDANFIEPPGVGGILQTTLDEEGIDILIGVESVNDTEITMLGALGDGANPPGQDLCTATIPFPTADFSNPYFTVGPEDVTFTVQGTSFTLQGLNVDGAFAPDGSLIAGATLSGTIDTREVASLLDDAGGDENAVCELAAQVGVTCEACADGSGDFCLSALVTNIEATEVTGVTITPVTEAEAETNCPGE